MKTIHYTLAKPSIVLLSHLEIVKDVNKNFTSKSNSNQIKLCVGGGQHYLVVKYLFSFSGKKFQEAVMKTTADNDVYLFLLSSQGLEIHQIVDGDSQMVETQTVSFCLFRDQIQGRT